MKLKLAEYKDGKFLEFLELGEDFLYGGYFIKVNIGSAEYSGSADFYDLDETDPLNRFNGLFDGSTYGEGRFILKSGCFYKEYPKGYIEGDVVYITGNADTISKRIGNLHQSPELFKELNNE